MPARSSSAEQLDDKELLITRVLDAPRSVVFHAWTDPQERIAWWGPSDGIPLRCDLDPQPGGAWRAFLRLRDGASLWQRGVFCEVVEPVRLVFTHACDAPAARGHETLVAVTFAEHGGRTRLVLHQGRFANAAERDALALGWERCLDRLNARVCPPSATGRLHVR